VGIRAAIHQNQLIEPGVKEYHPLMNIAAVRKRGLCRGLDGVEAVLAAVFKTEHEEE
jgi:hypothetical protein